MPQLILFNKPFGVICQFSDDGKHPTLAEYIDIKNIYPAGRLDHDSEGLLLLTDDGKLQHKISHPKNKMAKTYWVQVDGDIDETAIKKLQLGVKLKDGLSLPAQVKKTQQPQYLWDRQPPVRIRKNIPTSWIEITIKEGRNRQVRRMTAAVGFPTLRLIRYQIGEWNLDNLKPGIYNKLFLNNK